MTPPGPESVRVVRRGFLRLELFEGTDEQSALDAIPARGELLKLTPKTSTKRVDAWVIKSSRFNAGLGALARTFRRARYRQGWRASLRLHAEGVNVPAPRAFVERGALGVILGNSLITDYVEGCVGLEEWVGGSNAFHGGGVTLEEFLSNLADALNRLADAGAVHTDLSGNNILTRDGSDFYFIDLDAVRLDVPYDVDMRSLNHAQIWTSLRGVCDETTIAPFFNKVLPPGHTLPEWTLKVRDRLRARLHAAGVTH